jgi:hypothetical protein
MLPTDPGAALSQVLTHARRFRGGQLAEEREGLRIHALIGLGRSDEARAAANRFRKRWPQSLFLPALEQKILGLP